MELEVEQHGTGWTCVCVCGQIHTPPYSRANPRKIICVAGWTLRRSGSNREINPHETREGYN